MSATNPMNGGTCLMRTVMTVRQLSWLVIHQMRKSGPT